MNIQPKSFHIAIGIAERLASKIENRVLIMNDSMVVGTQNHDIACVIIQASNKVIDMVSMDESRPIGFSNKLTANLASESIGDFQILADGFSQMANLAHPCPKQNIGRFIRTIQNSFGHALTQSG